MTFRKGIPTVYRGVQFRSRIEARWAAFFDELRWSWEYEPVDLDGYIPDFVLRFHRPLLVEVKHELLLDHLEQYVAKIEASGWTDEAVVVGACLFDDPLTGGAAIGLHGEHDSAEACWGWGPALIGPCGDSVGLTNSAMRWSCRRCGEHTLGGKTPSEQIDAVRASAIDGWRRAGNAVQWRRPT